MTYTWSDVGSTWATIGGNYWQSLFLPIYEPVQNDVQVQLGLARAFILDDVVAGVIGGTDYVLSGEDFVDITNFVYSVSTDRGKNTELDRYKSGTTNVELRNQNRYFDPNYAESPFAGNLVPRRGLRVLVDSVPVFTGKVADWNISYAQGNKSLASVDAVDNFTLLATQLLTAGTVPSETTGARIERVLDMPTIQWPANERFIDVGQSTLGSQVLVGDENALTYLQQVEVSEFGGPFFISKEGYIRFRDRLEALNNPLTITFADDGSGIEFEQIEIEYGSEQLYNQITVQSPAGTATADYPVSQQKYGIASTSFDTLLSSQLQVDLAAGYIGLKYSDPILRIRKLTVNLKSVTPEQRAFILERDLGDVARVITTPNGIGDPIDQEQLIIGIAHTVDIDSHFVTFSFTPLQTNPFTIGDPVLGILGENAPGVLGF